MSKTVKAICITLGLVCILSGLSPINEKSTVNAKMQDIKAVWAATLYSMDYPSQPTTDAEALKADADRLIADVKAHGFNTLFLQVRPSGDAFYNSDIFPTSRYLTGTEGTAPSGGFDPLEYITAKAHENGISLHAWINPYRLTVSEKDSDTLTDASIAKKYPHLVVKHTDGKLYLNPGEPEAMELVVKGAVEIVQRYNVDGIHIDDYFYPSTAFPDGETFTKYGGSFMDIGDWRRSNTRELVKKLGTAIKEANPDIIFSVSPCGIWANKESHPDGSSTAGKQAYFDYYADTRLWVKEELMDMIIPQIYWEAGYSIADFEELAKWWNNVAEGTDVALCIGQAAYRVADTTDPNSPWFGQRGRNELANQIKFINGLKNVCGYSHYRLGSITKDKELSSSIKKLNTSSLQIFSDTEKYPWAKDAIERLYNKGIVKGMGDGTFGCSRTVSRADFTVMLVRSTGQDVPFTKNFADVAPDKYYYKEVGIAKVLGFAAGREGNIFDPSGSITREDMATLVWRAMTKTGDLPEESNFSLEEKFPDANEISSYASQAVSVLVEKGILSGYETGEFKPKGIATRAECAVILDRLQK